MNEIPVLPLPTLNYKIRVLCVDDSRSLTAALGRCFDSQADMESAGSLDRADDLVVEIKSRRVDVVLMDWTMPGEDPMAVLREVQALPGDQTQVIVFSGHNDDEVIDIAAHAGARGFICKGGEVLVMLEAIRAVFSGKVPFRVWR